MEYHVFNTLIPDTFTVVFVRVTKIPPPMHDVFKTLIPETFTVVSVDVYTRHFHILVVYTCHFYSPSMHADTLTHTHTWWRLKIERLSCMHLASYNYIITVFDYTLPLYTHVLINNSPKKRVTNTYQHMRTTGTDFEATYNAWWSIVKAGSST